MQIFDKLEAYSTAELTSWKIIYTPQVIMYCSPASSSGRKPRLAS